MIANGLRCWGRTADSVLATSPLYGLPLRSVSQSVVTYYRIHGIRFFVWTTDNPAEDNATTWANLIDWGVSDIITSDPAELTAYLASRSASRKGPTINRKRVRPEVGPTPVKKRRLAVAWQRAASNPSQ